MTLKNWLKNMDLIFDVTIWGEDEEEPLYEGDALDIPWTIVDYPIGRTNNDKEEPIYICLHKNKYGVNLPKVIINVIETDDSFEEDEDYWLE